MNRILIASLIVLTGCLSSEKAAQVAGGGILPGAGGGGGTPIPASALVVTPSTFSFGTKNVGVTTSQSFSVFNQANVPVDITNVALTGSMYNITSDGCTGTTLASEQTCTVTVAFTPTGPGNYVAVVSIDFSTSFSTINNVSFNMNGAGNVAQPALTISPSTHAFGNVATNASSTVMFTVSNNTSVTAFSVTPSISGTDYSILSQTCNAGNLSSGGSCTVTVRFSPTAILSRLGSLDLDYSSAQSINYTDDASLSGTGVAPSVSFTFNGFNNPGTDVSSLTPNGAVLNWTAEPAASYYRIFRVTPGPVTPIATITSPSTNSYTLSGLTPGDSYQYRVNAYDNLDISDGNNNLASFTTPAGTGATFNGWSDVVATGSVESDIGLVDTAWGNTPTGVAPSPPTWPAALADNIHVVSTSTVKQNAIVRLAWDAFTFTSGGVASSHHVYRGATSTGPWTDITAVIGNVLSGNTFIDSNVTNENTYYYKIQPVLGIELVPAATFDSVISVYVPPKNMALIHRWIANREVCTNLLGKTFPGDFDRAHNYRCNYVWGRSSSVAGCPDSSVVDPTCNHAFAPQIPWDDKAFWDIGHSLIADRYEAGCKISAQAGSVGSALPGAGSDGDVFMGTGTSGANSGGGSALEYQCYIRNGGSWKSYVLGTANVGQHNTMTTNMPGYPVVALSQSQAYSACQQRNVAGVGNLRLWRRHELTAARAWKGIHNAPTDFLAALWSSGADHASNGSCNTKYADGVDLSSPMLTKTGALRHLTSGSWATRNCKTRYDLHDQIGNIGEWTSDQLYNCNSTGTCTFGASSLDSGNYYLENFIFDASMGKQWTSALGVNASYFVQTAWPITNTTTMLPMFGFSTASVDALLGSKVISSSHFSQDYGTMGMWNSILGLTDGSMQINGRFGAVFPVTSSWRTFNYDTTGQSPVYGSYLPHGYRCVGEVP